MESIIAALINVGFGGMVVAAMLWFLRQLVVVTIPKMSGDFVKALEGERRDRRRMFRQLTTIFGKKLDQLTERHQDDYSNLATTVALTEASVERIVVTGCGRGPFPRDLECPPAPLPDKAAGEAARPV